MDLNRLPLAACLLTGICRLAGSPADAATGTVFYNHTLNAQSVSTVRAIRSDGTQDQAVPVALSSAFQPVVSRDGRFLLVTTIDPVLPAMISQNVFSVDLANGNTTRITHYVDTVSDGITTFTNVFNEPDFDTYSYYTSHAPNYKGYSPGADRVVVLDLAYVSGKQPRGVRMPATPSPVLEVFPVQQVFPIGEWLFAGAERTGVNQGGDGVDWHPSRDELVGAFRSNIPSFGNLGESQTEGTVVMVFRASGLNPLLRKLTTPTGQSFVDFDNFFIVGQTEQDYAPAISNDGTRVAYVRNTLASDSRLGPGVIYLAKCSIRIINYDGSGDREILSFGNQLWVTKLAWSPDDSEIAFDVAPRLVVNGLEFQRGDVFRSEILVVRPANGAVRTLVRAPAAFPSWSPLDLMPVNPQRPAVRLTRKGNQIELDVSQLTTGRQIDIESTTDLRQWTSVQTFSAPAASHQLSLAAPSTTSAVFYRVRMR